MLLLRHRSCVRLGPMGKSRRCDGGIIGAGTLTATFPEHESCMSWRTCSKCGRRSWIAATFRAFRRACASSPRRSGGCRRRSSAAREPDETNMRRRSASSSTGVPQSSSVLAADRRLEQHEFAIARDDVVDHLPRRCRRRRCARAPAARRSRASSALESSIDWFWQTMQRSCAESAARAGLQRRDRPAPRPD